MEDYKLKLRLKSCVANLKPFYRKIFSSWIESLKKNLSDCNSVLDLGCGYNSPIQYCGVFFSVGVELFEPYLSESEKKGIHNQYVRGDIQKIEFKPKFFDAVIALEVLEHLTKEEGYKLLMKMEGWARKKVIITVPNGYFWQGDYDNNLLQTHKCGWNSSELRKLGFKIYGINGWKKLRGNKGLIRHKPFFFWKIISDLSQKAIYWYPEFAFQLFAVKKINDER